MISHAEENNSPLSPTLSAASFISSSWQQKSHSELIPILKSAYRKLKLKDDDLQKAAQYGNSLLEDNIALKSSYEQLLQNAPYPTPTQSTSLISLDDEEDEEWLEYVEPARTKEALVEMLQRQNTDLQNQLEQVLSNQQDLDRAHQIKSKHLEDQVDHLQEQLERATNMIQEMEKNRKSRKTLTKDSSTNLPTCCAEADENLKQLKSDYDHLSEAKVHVERQLNEVMQEIATLRLEYDMAHQDNENLRRDFIQQSSRVSGLIVALDDYRYTLDRFRNRDAESSSNAPSMANSYASSSIYSDGDYNNERSLSLHTELNMATNKEQPLNGNTDPIMFQANVDSTINSIYNRVDGMDNAQAIDDVLSMIGKLANEYDHTRFLQQKRHLCYNGEYDVEEVREKDEEPQSIYPSLEKFSVPVAANGSQKASQGAYQLSSLLLWVGDLVRFYLVVAIASIVCFKKGPAAVHGSS